jgi:Lung seven transmembrane receptor
VKLTLYRHFTNTLIFSVIASAIFMLYSIRNRLELCLTVSFYHFQTHIALTAIFLMKFQDWKNLWIDEAYWHLLFSVLLLVIMILWRPTNNNQRLISFHANFIPAN